MTNQKLRFGVIGCADIAMKSVIPGIQQSDFAEVVAIASRQADKATAAAKQFGIARAYGRYEDLLEDDDVDAVYIPLPNHLHYEWTLRAAAAGKHVLCEKPLALDAAQAQAMVEACADAGVLLAEAFMYRYHPRYARIKEIIASGEIGEIRGIRGAFTFNNAADTANVRYRRAMGGGSLYDVGCYPISAARLLLDREPVAVTVQGFLSSQHDDVDMMAAGLLEFPGDVALLFDCGMWAASRNTLEIVGSVGRIELPYAFLGDATFFVATDDDRREETFPPLNPYTLQADSFARSALFGEPLAFEPVDAVNNMRVIDACLRSMASRQRIVL
ncbi:deoxyfructose oxidoreductase [Alicyclobacillus acidoterrestris]|uniref:Gfo/Idh/MocA family protein n=1 Tax=Alicyclobacillus suci TaxID=2816080 RepID=UPI001195A0EC|nr:Gfo/Idh/MocA family oxidoreductase [Alicyclobacillus suci]GEO24449.1 deoxyfructose oxidoreductase [Alicyclobacillus acidoterrestris]